MGSLKRTHTIMYLTLTLLVCYSFTSASGDPNLAASCPDRPEGGAAWRSAMKTVCGQIESACSAGTSRPSCSCGVSHKAQSSKIDGEQDAGEVNVYPWQVGIVDRTRSNKLVCGGTLLSAYHVLTERSCAKPDRTSSSDYLVLVGEHGTTDSVPRLYAVSHSKRYAHTLSIGNDGYGLWIFILAERVTFSSVVAPICLPTSTSRLSLFEGEEVTVTG